MVRILRLRIIVMLGFSLTARRQDADHRIERDLLAVGRLPGNFDEPLDVPI
jgi:hypothetical protein